MTDRKGGPKRRLVLVEKQGLTGRKVDCLSIPYRCVVRFRVETAGTFDLDAELMITKSVDIYEMQSLLAEYVCCA